MNPRQFGILSILSGVVVLLRMKQIANYNTKIFFRSKNPDKKREAELVYRIMVIIGSIFLIGVGIALILIG